MENMVKKRAFTLIELLIVVAIIAILAAIAVPNFLEAQTRAKVSRTRADMRSVATAVESYFVDRRAYPAHIVRGGFLFWYGMDLGITTPVAYLSSRSALKDPFLATKDTKLGLGGSAAEAQLVGGLLDNEYMWVNWRLRDLAQIENQFPGTSPYNLPQWYGAVKVPRVPEFGPWELASQGPLGEFSQAIDPSTRWGHYFLLYDPTNGTISTGAIVRSAASPEGVPVTGYIADGVPGNE